MSDRVTEQHGPDDSILDLWPGGAAPAGFADRVLEAAAGAGARRPVGRPTRRIALAAAAALAVAAGLVLLVMVGADGGARDPDAGAHVAGARQTVRIGRRAVAVAEPGAALSWRTDGGAASVEQSRGSVFYRVDRADRPFTVVTPAGRVIVAGTCFRVDIRQAEGRSMMMGKSTLVAAGAGAALATAVTVAVYEGVVTAENDRGSARVAAGEHAVLAPGLAPAARAGAESGPDLAAALPAPAPADATREELRAREGAYRGQVAALRRRVAELEHTLEGMPRPTEPGEPPRDKYDDFTPEELAWMAKRCELRYDVPTYALELGAQVSPAEAASLRLADDERGAVNQVLSEGNSGLVEQMRQLYIELTGDRAVADALSPRNLQHEIFSKSRPGDLERALQRLSAERAGIAQPPAELTGLSPVERLLRLLAASGDQYQERLAAIIGPDRAAQLRRAGAGTGTRIQAGCPEADQTGKHEDSH